jgi:hypothetical protein
MCEDGDVSRVAGDSSEMLHHFRGALSYRIAQLAAAIMAANAPADFIAGQKVLFRRRPHIVTREFNFLARAEHFRQRLAGFEAKLRLQA